MTDARPLLQATLSQTLLSSIKTLHRPTVLVKVTSLLPAQAVFAGPSGQPKKSVPIPPPLVTAPRSSLGATKKLALEALMRTYLFWPSLIVQSHKGKHGDGTTIRLFGPNKLKVVVKSFLAVFIATMTLALGLQRRLHRPLRNLSIVPWMLTLLEARVQREVPLLTVPTVVLPMPLGTLKLGLLTATGT